MLKELLEIREDVAKESIKKSPVVSASHEVVNNYLEDIKEFAKDKKLDFSSKAGKSRYFAIVTLKGEKDLVEKAFEKARIKPKDLEDSIEYDDPKEAFLSQRANGKNFEDDDYKAGSRIRGRVSAHQPKYSPKIKLESLDQEDND